MRSFSATYDHAVDILYLNALPLALGDGDGVDESPVLEYDVERGVPSGATVLGFHRNDWPSRLEELAASLQNHLAMPSDLVRKLVGAAVDSADTNIVLTVDDGGYIVSDSPPNHDNALPAAQ